MLIYLNQSALEQQYGPSFATGGYRRFNAESCSRHEAGAYKYEFGYISGYCCYAIIQKQDGSALAVVERQSFLALNGSGEWKILDGTEAQRDKPITFQYTPPKEETTFTSPLFASHQWQRAQLVIYYPSWHPDLAQIEADPL